MMFAQTMNNTIGYSSGSAVTGILQLKPKLFKNEKDSRFPGII